MMKLYYSPGACSLAPHITLYELIPEAGFEVERVDLRLKKTSSGADYTALNPKGYVPLLIMDNGDPLTEVAVILSYLADLFPARHLIPPSHNFLRYRAMEWINYIATEVHKGFSPLFALDRLLTSAEAREEFQTRTKENLGRRLDFLSSQLRDHSYLLGENFSVADIYLFVILNWTNYFQMELTRWPSLVNHFERIKNRPAAQEAMKREGLIKI